MEVFTLALVMFIVVLSTTWGIGRPEDKQNQKVTMTLNKPGLIRCVDLIMGYSHIPRNQRNFDAVQSQIILSRKEYRNTLGKVSLTEFENRATVRTEATRVTVNFTDPVIQAIIQLVYENRKLNYHQRELLRTNGIPVNSQCF